MNCHDARDWFSALLGGEIGLTEWALVETHGTRNPGWDNGGSGQGRDRRAGNHAPPVGLRASEGVPLRGQR